MQDNANIADTVQFAEVATSIQIIDNGTITQVSTDIFCPGPTGPSGPVGTPPDAVVDSADITEVTTDAFPSNPPTLLSWPHNLYGA